MTESDNLMLNYDEANAALSRSEDPLEAADIHGILCGWICAAAKKDAVPWHDEALGGNISDPHVAEQVRTIVLALYEHSFQKLHEMAFDFQLFLPDDETPMPDRARALGQWCGGFMYGLGIANLSAADAPSEEAREALFHMSEIAKLDYNHVDVKEEDEVAFVDIVEYIRLAVLGLYSEFYQSLGDVGRTDGTKEKERVLH